MQAMHARLGTTPDLRQDWQSALAGARAALGDAAFDAAIAAGAALDDRHAIGEALGEAD